MEPLQPEEIGEEVFYNMPAQDEIIENDPERLRESVE